jgi:cytochrome c oxidase subunit 3
VGLAAITMSFAALTSALFVRQGSANDWRHFALPSILYFNTVLLIGSSVTLETARRNFRRAAHDARSALAAPQWLYATLVLGLCFVAGQYLAWMKLRAEGLFLATNPSSSFFYVLTAVHALHVLGGLLGLTYVTWKMRRRVLRLNSLAAASHYWHFMDVLWLYVFFVLWIKMA